MTLADIAKAAQERIEELAAGEGIELDQIVVLILSDQCEPNAAAATMAQAESDEEVNQQTLRLLLSAAEQAAEHGGVRLAIAEVPFGQG